MTFTLKPHLDLLQSGKNVDGLTIKTKTRNGDEYKVVKYDKSSLGKSIDEVHGIGRFRSVILKNNQVKCIAPPKSLDFENFISTLSTKGCRVEELVDGTMINLFYDDSHCEDEVLGKWEIATRSSVGAEVGFFSSTKKTFRQMFIEAIKHRSNSAQPLSQLNNNFVYSIVLQHPENRIVVPFIEPSLYLVAAYSVTPNGSNIIMNMDAMQAAVDNCSWLYRPKTYAAECETNMLYSLRIEWESENKEYNKAGIMLHDNETGSRSKIRNPLYERIRWLRGNQPKLQYQYLSLSSSDRTEYLRYYPEAKHSFQEYESQVKQFVNDLYSAYIRCKVRHNVNLCDLPAKFRTHVYKLHGKYLNNLRSEGRVVTKDVVNNYVEMIPTALLMHGINRA